MKRIDLFFSNLLTNLKLIESSLDSYYQSNEASIVASETRVTKLAEFSTNLQDIISEIEETYSSKNELIENLVPIQEFLEKYDNFLSIFSDFEFNIFDYIKYWIILAEKINLVKESDIDLNQVLDIQNYDIIDLEENIIESNFIHYEIAEIKKSLVIYSLNTNFTSFIDDDIHSGHVDLLLIWINLINKDNCIIANQVVLLNSDNPPQSKDLKPILKLQVLLNGKHIKSLEKYELKPQMPNKKNFNFNEKYIQFESIANVLNEYNNQIYILDKFLKLYHVIENFMYKHRICKLEREKNGSPFHIRDFQILYEKFTTKEIICIQDFFYDVFILDYDGNNFLSLLRNEWNNLEVIDNTKIPAINNLLRDLALNTNSYKFDRLKTNLDAAMFANIVYKIRNAIVHNKDSENHFESTNLPEGAKFLLENFFIPNLERIIFHLIINKNDLVWFEKNHLLLYNI
ncbi:hypothetical protein [Flavobacterium fluviale]|uniref:Uncharacterized protein n=1 Tax=Flavobacterium fluviale TaxID=2249356 RepID=A0A344LTR8_9FLAO|nr:hypothetical protein [Flavobacterium fluviale]AXB57310.1 hypothetical protein HYN86_12180 [Flavobacterium fluviale]